MPDFSQMPEPSSLPEAEAATGAKPLSPRMAARLTMAGESVILIVAMVWLYLAKIDPSKIGLTQSVSNITAIFIPSLIASFIVSVSNLAILFLAQRYADNVFFLRSMKDIVEEVMLPLLGPFTILDSVFVALISGISEEMLFRGVMQNQLLSFADFIGLHQGQYQYIFAVALSAFAFGLAHFKNLHYLPYSIWALLVGILMSYLFNLTGSLYTPMLAHALINLVSINVLRTLYGNNEKLDITR
jgi:membrane protease YdiL (CAAX protease family)